MYVMNLITEKKIVQIKCVTSYLIIFKFYIIKSSPSRISYSYSAARVFAVCEIAFGVKDKCETVTCEMFSMRKCTLLFAP